MNEDRLLTIAIPTWNRNGQVNLTLGKLLPQLRPGISILVIDNASDVPVAETLDPAVAARVTLQRNPRNIGGPANVLRCLEEAGSEWIWLHGDDDEPADDAVDRVLAAIAAHPDCTLIDFGHPFKPEPVHPEPVECAGWPGVIRCMYYPRGEAELFAWSDGHMSNEILNVRRLAKYLDTGRRYLDTLYPHVAALFAAVDDGARCCFTGRNLAVLRQHGEAPGDYTIHAQVKGWHKLAELISDPAAAKRYRAALNTGVYRQYRTPAGLRALYHRLIPRRVKQWIRRVLR